MSWSKAHSGGRRYLTVTVLVVSSILSIACDTDPDSGAGSDASETQPVKVATDPTTGKTAAQRHLYYTRGVHNIVDCEPPAKCIAERLPGEPVDPEYPVWWSSDWTMYRVFSNFQKYPPPYDSPPGGLTPADYEISYGSTYYDSTYVPEDRDGTGAMMEHYKKRCLPIFPMNNHFTCSFISLGNKAYFLRYDDRPPYTPQCCLFSLQNHPPRRDFIKHLPYNESESAHLNNSLQAYSIRVPVGRAEILFAYAFYKEAQPDSFNADAVPYRHPQSFYFSGSPTVPPDAPIVSQNYTNFRMEQPDPEKIWDQVAQMCPAKPEWCCLFASDCPDRQDLATKSEVSRSWDEFSED